MWLTKCLVLFALVAGATALAAAPVSRIQVRIATGATLLSAGSVLELRIYEVGKPMRRLPLTHGEAWPSDSTRLIPIDLTEPLDPRAVSRFSVYFRAASPLTPPFEIAALDVELSSGHEPVQRLLDASLSGMIAVQGELMSDERDANSMLCMSDAECDDRRLCNGQERCAPRTAGADARGCVKGTPLVCPVNEVCAEGRGCRGPESAAK